MRNRSQLYRYSLIIVVSCSFATINYATLVRVLWLAADHFSWPFDRPEGSYSHQFLDIAQLKEMFGTLLYAIAGLPGLLFMPLSSDVYWVVSVTFWCVFVPCCWVMLFDKPGFLARVGRWSILFVYFSIASLSTILWRLLGIDYQVEGVGITTEKIVAGLNGVDYWIAGLSLGLMRESNAYLFAVLTMAFRGGLILTLLTYFGLWCATRSGAMHESSDRARIAGK